MALPPVGASQTRLALIEAKRGEYRGRLVQRFWLRFHLSLMLAATIGAGVLANQLLLAIPVHSMTLRWLIALAVSYAAFSALLAGGLVKSVRRMDEPDWEGSVPQATWKPLAIVAAFTVIAGLVAQYVAPGARTLGEVLMLLR